MLTNGRLVNIGGTETWTLTMANELMRQGHDVEVQTVLLGLFGKQFICPVSVLTEHRGSFDRILVNHLSCWDTIQDRYPNTPKAFTSHSAFLGIERFPDTGDYRKVAVTEEIAQGDPDVTIIRNPVDMHRFEATRHVSDVPERICYIANGQQLRAVPIIEEACNGLTVDVMDGTVSNVEDRINQADIVISFGRGALEAMACKRNVISADWRWYMDGFSGAGMIEPHNFDRIKAYNFTGRNDPIQFTADRLSEELAKYDPARGSQLYPMLAAEYAAPVVVQKYLDLTQ